MTAHRPALRVVFGLLAAFAVAPGAARATPQVILPEGPRPLAPHPPGLDLPRESEIEVPLSGATGAATAIGGYGEITLNAPLNNDPAVADVRRLVLFFGHNFTDRLRFYSEIEIEHAISSASDQGEVAVEQAFVDYLARRWINVRAGLLIVPIGIVNIYHEPPTFHGVDRPDTDLRIIPSTWRELGAGVFGAVGPVRYQLYGMTGLSAKGFSALDGLRDGHQEGQLARARDFAGVLRLDWEPLLGVAVGASGYYGNSGQGTTGTGATPVALVEVDARARWKGLEARAELANVFIGEADQLDRALAADDKARARGPVASRMLGGYGEIGYDLFHPLHLASGAQLVAFGRYEHTDTQASLPAGITAAPGAAWQTFTAGLTFRPVAELVVKADYQYRSKGSDPGYSQLDVGLGWMF